MIDTPVLISGAGPVGMTLALELARHGVRSIIAERHAQTTRHPKMDLTNGRSMELFHRLGVAEAMRAAGVPGDHLLDIVWATRPSGHVLHRFDYPSPDQKRAEARELNDGTQTLEPSLRISQVLLEPVLKEAVQANALIEGRFGWAVTACAQDAEGVDVTLTEVATGRTELIRAAWLAGCDGGASTVREQTGIKLKGQFGIAQAYMVHFRSEAPILARFGKQPAYHLQTGMGTLIGQNGKDIFTLQMLVPPGVDASTLDPAQLLRQFVGEDFAFEILVANPWKPHAVVAEAYRKGRILLAGDAAHQYIPTGGFGMNTGVCDAVGLGWMLAAVVQGWGGSGLLDAYEQERHTIGERNLEAALANMAVRIQAHGLLAEACGGPGIDAPEAAGKRAELARQLEQIGNAENEMWGIEHGYRYDSPVLWEEQGTAPPLDWLRVIPSTWPGSRLPLIHLRDGSALFDLLGSGFTLLVIGDADPGALPAAAAQAGVPLTVVRIPDEPRCRILECSMVLVRPDQHVAWRGNQPPVDADAVIAKVTGHTGATITSH